MLMKYYITEKLTKNDIEKHLNPAAQVVVAQLPSQVNSCFMQYLPELGHVVGVKKWDSQCDPQELKANGFQFLVKFIE